MVKRQGAVTLRLVTQPELLRNIKKELADWREYGVKQEYITDFLLNSHKLLISPSFGFLLANQFAF